MLASMVTPGDIPPERLLEIYSRTAAFYDQVVAGHQVATKLLAIEMLARQRGETFLEVAVGTGWCFSRIVEATGVERAVGLDGAIGMIDVTRRALKETGVAHAPMLLGDAAFLPLKDAGVNCLLCTYTLEVLPSQTAAALLREMRRVLRPEGRIVLAGLTFGEGQDAAFTDDWRRRYELDPEYFGGAQPILLTPLVEAAGLVVRERRYSGHGAGWPSEVVLAGRSDDRQPMVSDRP
jgi:ubiquinone/menaquinone biosynthesis C-methylase UbiE